MSQGYKLRPCLKTKMNKQANKKQNKASVFDGLNPKILKEIWDHNLKSPCNDYFPYTQAQHLPTLAL